MDIRKRIEELKDKAKDFSKVAPQMEIFTLKIESVS